MISRSVDECWVTKPEDEKIVTKPVEEHSYKEIVEKKCNHVRRRQHTSVRAWTQSESYRLLQSTQAKRRTEYYQANGRFGYK